LFSFFLLPPYPFLSSLLSLSSFLFSTFI
jgi:hypothetical protein